MFPLGAMLAGNPAQAGMQSYDQALDLQGQAAWGRGIQQMFQPRMPGAIPTGAPSQQPQGPGMPPQGPRMGPQAQAGGAPMGGGGPQQPAVPGAQPMAPPPMPGPQGPQRMPPPPPQQGGGPQQALGSMSFPQILQGIVQANPGASPGVIAHALKYAQPFMNAVALDQYRQAQIGLGYGRIDATERGQDIRAGTARWNAQAGMIRALIGQGYTLEEALQQVQTQGGGVPQPGPGGAPQPSGPQAAQPPVPAQPAQTSSGPPPPPPQPGTAAATVAGMFPGPGERMETIDQQGQTISDPPRLKQATATDQGMPVARPGAQPAKQQVAQSDTYKPPANITRLGWDETALRRAAQRYIDTGEYPHNLGTRPIAAQITGGINHYVNEIMREQNLTSQDVIKKQTQYGGEKAYQRSAGQQSARVESAANEVEQLIPQAIETSKNFQRYDYTALNNLYEKWKRQESDPAFNDFLVANFSLANAYGRAMNPLGQPRIAERKEREVLKILSEQTGHAGYVTQVRRLWKEVQASKKAQAETQQGRKPGDIKAPMPGDDPGVPATGGGLDTTPGGAWKPPPGVTIEKLN